MKVTKAVEAEVLITQPRALILMRAGVMTLATLLALTFSGPTLGEWEGWLTRLSFLAILGLSYLTTCLALLAERRGASRHWRLVIFLLDVPLVTALIHLTGGIESDFVGLYLIFILVGGMVLGDQGGFGLGMTSAAAYGLLLVGEAAGWLAPVGYGGLAPRTLGAHSADLARAGALALLPVMGAAAGTCGGLLSERRRLRAAARELDRARSDTDFVLSQLGSGVLSLDDSGRILHFNRAAGEILGLDVEQVLDHSLTALGAGGEGFVRWIEAARKGAAPLARQMVEFITPDGRMVPLGMTGSRTSTEGLIVVFQDLTSARHEEAERARKERLAAVGGLVAGITHEIRNCVKPIAGALDVLLQERTFAPQDRRLVELAARECQRLGRFVQALLDYGRVNPLVLEPVYLEDLLREVGELASVEANASVAVEIEVAPDAAGLASLLDREPLKQVLLNLTRNAIEAMGAGGGQLGLSLVRGGDAEAPVAVLRVMDSGPGVPEELRECIFEPFFTTKPGGTGFGLAIAAGIVERHGGTIEIGNVPSGGACFEVHLPEVTAFGIPAFPASGLDPGGSGGGPRPGSPSLVGAALGEPAGRR